jgi:hypothetical protein
LISVCADGTRAMIEMLDARGHYQFTRHGCDRKSAELAELIRTTLALVPQDIASDAAEQLEVSGS